jgi:uncharacterized damage-inducible protein DinB
VHEWPIDVTRASRDPAFSPGRGSIGASTLPHVSPIQRPERAQPSTSAGEAETLWEMLDYYRGTLLTKCAELSDEELRRRAVPPSNLSLLGMLRHAADFEVYWFGHVFAGADVAYAYDPQMVGADFDDLEESPGVAVAARFQECVEQSNRLTAGVALNTHSARMLRGQSVSLRFIVVHLIEEYARHCGHADLLREVIDGQTGQ